MEKVIVGMSGGVDSFVTALLLKRQGYDVIGVVLELYEARNSDEVELLCKELEIGFMRWDGRDLFCREVVKPFIEGYKAGRTPSPCCICNSKIKWALLAKVADALGVTLIATGHYVRIAEARGRYYIRKGVDNRKDQSYFLWGVSQEILRRTLTPLGDWTKAEVKDYAAINGYVRMADKPESMGICFLRGKDYRDFIFQHLGEGECLRQEGNILDRNGRIIGQHSGILNYTIGQKRGMPVEDGEPLYVAAIDADAKTIVADSKAALNVMELEVEQLNVVCREDLFADNVEIKIRGLGLNPVGYIKKVEEMPEDGLKIYLSSPAWAVAPGQPVAFYRGELLIGGGIIKK